MGSELGQKKVEKRGKGGKGEIKENLREVGKCVGTVPIGVVGGKV